MGTPTSVVSRQELPSKQNSLFVADLKKSVLGRDCRTQSADCPKKHTSKNQKLAFGGEASGKAEPPRSPHSAKGQLAGSYGCQRESLLVSYTIRKA